MDLEEKVKRSNRRFSNPSKVGLQKCGSGCFGNLERTTIFKATSSKKCGHSWSTRRLCSRSNLAHQLNQFPTFYSPNQIQTKTKLQIPFLPKFTLPKISLFQTKPPNKLTDVFSKTPTNDFRTQKLNSQWCLKSQTSNSTKLSRIHFHNNPNPNSWIPNSPKPTN